jgi:uncharacterized protein YbcI
MDQVAQQRERSSNERVSIEVVRIYKEYLGRGPTRARTYLNDGIVTCVLHDCLTKAEKTLVASGNGDEVRGLRRKFQEAMRRDLVAAVEKELQRGVTGFLSDQDFDPDIAVEMFVLEENATVG